MVHDELDGVVLDVHGFLDVHDVLGVHDFVVGVHGALDVHDFLGVCVVLHGDHDDGFLVHYVLGKLLRNGELVHGDGVLVHGVVQHDGDVHGALEHDGVLDVHEVLHGDHGVLKCMFHGDLS